MTVLIGTAGWSIPRNEAAQFPAGGSALERYSARFPAVEINSSFYRSHQRSTWTRWAASVPAAFRFAVKMPKEISHVRKLVDCDKLLDAFLDEVGALGEKLSVLLLQLPPKLAFDEQIAGAMFQAVRDRTSVQIVCEPRHPSWFEDQAGRLLEGLQVARVAADPSPAFDRPSPGGWRGLTYWRLHGTPHIYRSSYDDAQLRGFARAIEADLDKDAGVWCMFDNTAGSAAVSNALRLMDLLGPVQALPLCSP